ncbi:MAG: GAF domain-containing protein, partial [Acidobacteria bacterium]
MRRPRRPHRLPDSDSSGRLGRGAGRLLAALCLWLLAAGPAIGPAPKTSATTLAFDWRELKGFEIPETALPGGASVQYPEPGFWTFHPGWIIAAVFMLGGQTALIVTMLAQRRKRAAERSLTARLRFETVLSDVTAALGGVPTARMDMAVRAAVAVIREYLAVDRVTLFELTADGRAVRTMEDCAPGSPVVPPDYLLSRVPSIGLALTSLQPFVAERLDDLPPDASQERGVLREGGIRSLAVVPLEVGGQALGALSCVSHTSETTWPADRVQQVRTLGQALANVVQRKHTDTAVAESDRLRGDILSSMPAQIAVLDRH